MLQPKGEGESPPTRVVVHKKGEKQLSRRAAVRDRFRSFGKTFFRPQKAELEGETIATVEGKGAMKNQTQGKWFRREGEEVEPHRVARKDARYRGRIAVDKKGGGSGAEKT